MSTVIFLVVLQAGLLIIAWVKPPGDRTSHGVQELGRRLSMGDADRAPEVCVSCGRLLEWPLSERCVP